MKHLKTTLNILVAFVSITLAATHFLTQYKHIVSLVFFSTQIVYGLCMVIFAIAVFSNTRIVSAVFGADGESKLNLIWYATDMLKSNPLGKLAFLVNVAVCVYFSYHVLWWAIIFPLLTVVEFVLLKIVSGYSSFLD